jgi:ABC-type bacteriocin/lantibiotic exporter with double-glycine peptidase domain
VKPTVTILTALATLLGLIWLSAQVLGFWPWMLVVVGVVIALNLLPFLWAQRLDRQRMNRRLSELKRARLERWARNGL